MYKSAIVLIVAALLAACAGSAGESSTLAVNVRGSVSVIPTSFSGYYIYEDYDGAEVRRNVMGSGNFNDVFSGKRIVRVAVRRTSSDGLIGLVLTSDGHIVYDSGMLQTDELILYEADS